MNLQEQFQKELESLRNKYPMCYIEAWTPEDFNTSLATNLNWEDDTCIEIAQELYDSFDANDGTSWTSLDMIKSNLSFNNISS